MNSRAFGSTSQTGRSERVVSFDIVRASLTQRTLTHVSVFRHFDRDSSGSIDQLELNAALKGFGYNLSGELLELIMNKYSRHC